MQNIDFFSLKVQISEGKLKENSSAALAHLKAYQEKTSKHIYPLYLSWKISEYCVNILFS